MSAAPRFELIWEVDSPSTPDLGAIRQQVATARSVATAALVPDNHTGRATVSSLTVAREVQADGLPAIACLNARDRNLLGLRRDLMTSLVHGVEDLLLVYGDDPEVGERAGPLTVRTMLEECRAQAQPLRVSVATGLRPLPAWKREADQLFVQVSYDLEPLVRWRETLTFDGPVYPAVLVVPSLAMAQRLAATVPQLTVPDRWLAAVAADPTAGVRLAAELIRKIRDSGAFDGVHVIAGRRGPQLAAELAGLGTVPHPRATAAV